MNENLFLDELDLVVVDVAQTNVLKDGGTSAGYGAPISCSGTVSRTQHNSCTGHPSGKTSVSMSRYNPHAPKKKH